MTEHACDSAGRGPRQRAADARLERVRQRVLIIDDDASVRGAIATLLSAYHEVVPVDGGALALELLARDSAFDVVLCDLMMPGIDGVQVCETLVRSYSPLVPHTAVLSGGVVGARTQAFLQAWRGAVLIKPCSRAELLALIDELAAPAQVGGSESRNE